MSPYIEERAEAVIKLLPADDQQVLREHIGNLQMRERADARRRHAGPHWIWPALALLLIAALLGPTVHGVVGCFRSEELRGQRECCERGAAALRAVEAICPEAP